MNRQTRRSFLQRSGFGLAACFSRPEMEIVAKPGETVIAETSCGKVRGSAVEGVLMFRGVPYGGPTEGALRFLPPSGPVKWAGVREATSNGPRCIQSPGVLFLDPRIGPYFSGGRANRVELVTQPDSENCLVLNVLTPGLHGKRAVMVYIHGGGFTGGSDALTLLSEPHVREQDVVLVGVNHRINVFGYTYLGGLSEKYAVGNPGQLDLVAALEWVRDNIGSFGGDAGNVTIFGESGGGAKVSTLMAMPAAKGLFHKAYVQSGSLLHVDDADAGTRKAKELLSRLNLTKAEELQNVPAAELFRASSDVGLAEGPAPVVDGHSIPHQTWEPSAPSVSAGVPMIIGNCKDESTLFSLQNESLYRLDEAGLRVALEHAGIPVGKVDPLLRLYTRDHPKDTPSDLYFRISADRGARHNAVRQAELKLEQRDAPVFAYYFQWDTPLMDGKLRAFHTADLPLEMRLVLLPESEQLSRLLSGAWGSFAKTGSPSRPELEWPAYTTSQRTTMMFDVEKSHALHDPDRDERLMLLDMPSGALL